MIRVFPDAEAVAQAAASTFVSVVQEAISERGQAVVALSGGSTPKRLHALLVDAEIDWSRVIVVWGDERFVPASDPQSNEKMARETLLGAVSIPEGNIRPMVQSEDAEADAASYDAMLRQLGPIDLLLAGMGGDGHTLSLFPGEPGVHERERWVIAAAAPVNAPVRITLTPAAAHVARRVLFLVCGSDKAEALSRCLEGPLDLDETPSQALARVSPAPDFYVDKPAAKLLTANSPQGAAGIA